MRIRPFIGTLVGVAIGLLAIIVWLVTFEPHGGPELSLFVSGQRHFVGADISDALDSSSFVVRWRVASLGYPRRSC
jgi:hypothetical protein